MVPKGTVPQQAATNCRLTRHISTMPDALTSPVSTAARLGASSLRLEPLVATSQPKDWQKWRLPHPPHLPFCVPGDQTTQRLGVAYTYDAM